MDGLEAEPKPGGHQASAECTFKMCSLQGFGNISFSMLTSSQLFFHFCPTHHNSFYQELHGPAGSVICGAKIPCNQSWQGAAEPSRDSLGSRAASSCRSWARDSTFAFQQCPHHPNDDGYRRQFLLIPSPGSHTNTCCRAASAHQIEQEQQLDVTLRCPWVLELHPQAGSWSQPMPPMTQFRAGKLDYGSIDPLSFPLRFCWWSSERGHLSLPCLLRQLPTHQRAELTSLELFASNQAKQQKYPRTVKNRKVWQTRSVPGYTEHLPNLYSQGLKKGCQHILQTVFYIIFTV